MEYWSNENLSEIERIHTAIEEYTAGWGLLCEEYLARGNAFQDAIALNRANMEEPRQEAEKTGGLCDLSPTEAMIQCLIEEFSHETRMFQQKGFEYLATVETCEIRLAALEGRTLFAPA